MAYLDVLIDILFIKSSLEKKNETGKENISTRLAWKGFIYINCCKVSIPTARTKASLSDK